MTERPQVTITPCTANSVWVELPDNVQILVGESEIIVHSNGKKVTVRP